MIVPGDQWPIFLYAGSDYDPEDPWKGLFRGTLLVSVSPFYIPFRSLPTFLCIKAYKHVFTSPSSVEKGPRATRSGNARIHGMTSVTPASIAYIATQVSTYSASLQILKFRPFDRFGSPSALRQSSQGLILLPIRNASTIAFWSILTTSMNNWKSESF
jgi:hypothetical protein